MNGRLSQASLPLMVLVALLGAGCNNSSGARSSAASSARNGTYMVCYTTSPSHGISVSSVFHVPPADQVTMLEEPWAKDFRRYVGQSGDAGAISVTCAQVDPKDPDAALKGEREAWLKQGLEVKQLKWKYAG